jgi:GNAT superfamily N-acetyltransferase
MKSVSVQQVILDDLPAVARLFDQYRQFQGRPADLKGCEQFLRARIDHGESVLFLGRIEGQAVGFAQLYPIYSSVSLKRVFVLNDLFVGDAGRRQGVATALLQATESYAWSMGASSLRLHVAGGNQDAQALYLARGWILDDHFMMYQRFPDE